MLQHARRPNHYSLAMIAASPAASQKEMIDGEWQVYTFSQKKVQHRPQTHSVQQSLLCMHTTAHRAMLWLHAAAYA